MTILGAVVRMIGHSLDAASHEDQHGDVQITAASSAGPADLVRESGKKVSTGRNLTPPTGPL
jgi:hypothetical protein